MSNLTDRINYGIDKTILGKVFVVSIDDYQKLSYNSEIFYTTTQEGAGALPLPLTTGGEALVQQIKIVDNVLFGSFQLGAKKDRGAYIYYTILDLAIDSKDKIHNLMALSVGEYQQKLRDIKDYMKSRYGLIISFKYAEFKEIELNITRDTSYKFNEYEVMFQAMKKHISRKKYKLGWTGETLSDMEKGTVYFTSKTKRQELKLYDKTKQLEQKLKIMIEENYLRIEYTLRKYDKIQKELGTSRALDLTDEAIKSFLNASITDDIINTTNKYIEETTATLEEKYKEIKGSGRYYQKEFINHILYKGVEIFDIEQALEIMKKDAKKNYNRLRKNVYSIASEKAPQRIDNIKKLEEIIELFIIK